MWQKSIVAAIGFGVAIAFAFFLSYVFVVVGVTLTGMGVLALKRRGLAWVASAMRDCVCNDCVGLCVFYLMTGFDPIGTYRAIVAVHDIGVEELRRPKYPRHVPFRPGGVCDGVWVGWDSSCRVLFSSTR